MKSRKFCSLSLLHFTRPDMTSLTVSYKISTPEGFTSSIGLSKERTISFPLDTSTPSTHLASLEEQLGTARDQLNQELTEWKDQLKDVERDQTKKKSKKKKSDDYDDEEDEEEGDEE